MFFEDIAGKGNVCEWGKGNGGYDRRSQMIANSKIVHFSTGLAFDVCGLTKPLPNNTVYTIKLTRNSDQFTIMSKENDYIIEILDLNLEVAKILPTQTYLSHLDKTFATQPMHYDFTRTKILKFGIPKGVYDASQYALFDRGELPRMIMVCLTDQKAMHGVCDINPFNFNHYDLSEICLTKNNIPIPSTPFKPQWSRGNMLRLYRQFFDNLGFYHTPCSNGITLDQFEEGLFIVPWDLTPDRCNGYHRHKPETGAELSLRLTFGSETPEVLQLLVYAVYESSFTIDKIRGVDTQFVL